MGHSYGPYQDGKMERMKSKHAGKAECWVLKMPFGLCLEMPTSKLSSILPIILYFAPMTTYSTISQAVRLPKYLLLPPIQAAGRSGSAYGDTLVCRLAPGAYDS